MIQDKVSQLAERGRDHSNAEVINPWGLDGAQQKRKCIFQVTRAVSDFLSLHSGAHGRRYCLLLLEIKMQAEVQVLNTPIIKVEP